MRSTLQLQGDRRAVVDIPYSKLGLAGGSKTEGEHQCCDSKIIVTGGKRSSYNMELKKMVEEMEEAYDKDVREYQSRIAKLEQEKSAFGEQYLKEKGELVGDFNARKISYEKEIDQLREDNRRKDSEIRRLFQQKEVIIRNKINEFKQTEYISRLNEQEQILRFKELEIKELLNKLEASHIDSLRSQEKYQAVQRRLEGEISRLSQELTQVTLKLTSEQGNVSYFSKLKQEEGERNDRLLQESKYQLELASRSLKEEQQSNQSKNKQIASLKEKLDIQQQTILHLQAQLTSLRQQNSEQKSIQLSLSDKLILTTQALSLKQKDNQQLYIMISELKSQVQKVRKEYQGKERVYQVKIQRVIDGKDQIQQLQSVVFELEQQLKQLTQEKDYLSQDLKKSQQEGQGLKGLKLKLEVEISELRAYIAKRESSFRWMVERQIQKDIVASDIKPQLYKVSQVSEYSREDQKEATRQISEKIAINLQANLFGGYPEQIILQNNQ